MTFLARVAVGFLVAMTMTMLPRPASGSCVDAPTIEEHLAWADAVFVGTVDAVANRDRTAVVTVHEIWAGPDLPERVTIHGGPDGPDVSTSVDRLWDAGRRYLFAVLANDTRLEDNACSATQPWTDELAAFRPDGARTPSTVAEADAAGPPAALLVALIGSSVIALVGVAAFRRRA